MQVVIARADEVQENDQGIVEMPEEDNIDQPLTLHKVAAHGMKG